MNKIRICGGCRAEFTAAANNQRYCATCRQARAHALETLRSKVCRNCGSEGNNCMRGICADCRQAKENIEKERKAAKLARINANGGCKKCGGIVASTWSKALCEACFEERQKQNAAEARKLLCEA